MSYSYSNWPRYARVVSRDFMLTLASGELIRLRHGKTRNGGFIVRCWHTGERLRYRYPA